MSKAILIIDMPKCCDECSVMCEQYYSAVKNKDFNNDMKPDDCPLREVPQKKDTQYNPARNPYITEGWNACLNEILGE